MDETIKSFPFVGFEEDLAGDVRDISWEHRHEQDAPSHYGIQGQTSFDAFGGFELTRFDAATTFKDFEEEFDLPTACIAMDFFQGLFEREDGNYYIDRISRSVNTFFIRIDDVRFSKFVGDNYFV